jgi:hypothetical protein
MKPKIVEVSVRHPREAQPVPIVADAAISTRGMHGGRLLPLLLLDTTQRPDVTALINVHHTSGEQGDVKTQWGEYRSGGREGCVALFLTFVRPVELFMILEFEVVRQGILVDQLLRGRGLYIAEANGDEDRFYKNPHRSKLVIEVPETGFEKVWDELFHKQLAQDFRSRGLSRGDARRGARSAIEELRKFGSLRMRDVHK